MRRWFRKKEKPLPSLIRRRTPAQRAAAQRKLPAQDGGLHTKAQQESSGKAPEPVKLPPKVLNRQQRTDFNTNHNIVARLIDGHEEQYWLDRRGDAFKKGEKLGTHKHNLIIAAHAGDVDKVQELALAASEGYSQRAQQDGAAAIRDARPEVSQNLRESAERSTQFANAYKLLAKNPQQAIDAMVDLRKAAGK